MSTVSKVAPIELRRRHRRTMRRVWVFIVGAYVALYAIAYWVTK
jgi:hypothetical protein